ncbi:MAG: multiple sugar transport system permease protein [Cryptosporangiaceae bacterium]|jgi:multiple sugar transport system permease protein|nr:multiple sugar transport system permease protein [Cryptosporangiaceae bacterium]
MTTLTETRPAVAATSAEGSNGRRDWLLWIARNCVLIALAIAFLGPILFIFLTAVMPAKQTLTSNYWPTEWQWGNFAKVFTEARMLPALGNTILYASLSTVFMLVSSIGPAYAFSRLRWRGRNKVFVLVLVTMMLPPQVTIVPLYVLWTRWGLTGTLWPLILPNLLADAFSIFLLRQFLLTIPKEYSDAAKVDGCNEFAVLWRVILPMARPAIAATAMFMFFFAWNDYFGPLLYTSENPDNWPLSLALASFRGQYQVEWNVTMAATLLVMLPVMIVFFFAQKAFVEGVTLTGVKG